MVDHDAALVVVDLLAEVEDAVGLAADGEEVAGDLDQLAVLGLALLDHPRLDGADAPGLVEHGDGQDDAPPLVLSGQDELVARLQDEVRRLAAAGEGAFVQPEVVGEGRLARRLRRRLGDARSAARC